MNDHNRERIGRIQHRVDVHEQHLAEHERSLLLALPASVKLSIRAGVAVHRRHIDQGNREIREIKADTYDRDTPAYV